MGGWEGQHLVNSRRSTGRDDSAEEAVGGHHVDLDGRVATAVDHLASVDAADRRRRARCEPE